jgi:hypothetical protein
MDWPSMETQRSLYVIYLHFINGVLSLPLPKYEDICVSIIVVILKILNFLLSVKIDFGIPSLLATKFHTDSVIDSRFEVRLNPTLKDSVINRSVAKKKRSKRHKKEESTVEAVESVGENQSVWLDSSLKAEIAKLKQVVN